MNKRSRGYNAYFVLVLLLLALLIIPSLLDGGRVEYTRGELIHDLEEGRIMYASISPGRETPTGEVDFVFSDGPGKTLYVSMGIGLRCKCGDTFSQKVLIGRGLVLIPCFSPPHFAFPFVQFLGCYP